MNKIFLQFDQVILKAELWLGKRKNHFFGKRANSITERVIQRVLALSFHPYLVYCYDRYKNGKDPYTQPNTRLHLGGLQINTATGQIGITPYLYFHSVGLFVYDWTKTFLVILSSFLPSKKRYPKATLVFGIGQNSFEISGRQNSFKEFCLMGPVKPFTEATKLLVQRANNSIEEGRIIFCKNPVFELIRNADLGQIDKIGLLFYHLYYPFLHIINCIRIPVSVLYLRDIAFLPAMSVLDRKGMIESVIITNSNYLQQPLWMRDQSLRGFVVHEVHYSQNTIPFTYTKDLISADLPALRHVRVDEHWVWTEKYATYITNSGHKGLVHVVGPILWYLPVLNSHETKNNEIEIAIFDVDPITEEAAAKFGLITNYYRTEGMIVFIKTIVEVCKELEESIHKKISIRLKHKRPAIKNFHDNVYASFIQDMEMQNPGFKTIEYSTDIFWLLNHSDISIAIPYTSVAYVSAWLKKPAIYFDPYDELIFTNESSTYIKTAGNHNELKKTIREILS